MKSTIWFSLSLAAAFLAIFSPTAHSQGSLTPPGAPAPTMKTLDQIEARTVISSLPYTITNPGSYYLTENLTVSGGAAGIIVSSDNVTIDLNGFSLVGGASGTNPGINVPTAHKNLCVRNGTLTGWTNGAISAVNVTGSLFEKLRLVANSGTAALNAGTASTIKECVATANTSSFGTGFRTGNSCTVLDCSAFGNGGYGFILTSFCTIANSTSSENSADGVDVQNYCSVMHCNITDNSQVGLSAGRYCTITQCTLGANATNGIATGDGCTVESCTAGFNGIGIAVGSGGTVRSCTAKDNQYSGISVFNNCHVVGNTCDTDNTKGASSHAGIVVIGNGCRVEDNSLSGNGNAGLLVTSSYIGNIVIGNTFAGAEYIIPSGNTVGPLIESASGSTLSATASPLANIHIQ